MPGTDRDVVSSLKDPRVAPLRARVPGGRTLPLEGRSLIEQALDTPRDLLRRVQRNAIRLAAEDGPA